MLFNRCGHFSFEVEELFVSGTSVTVRVPIRRCALAERMIEVISQTENGWEAVRKLRTVGNDEVMETMAPGSARAAFGPDLEAIHSEECSTQRCQESCTPSYKTILAQFGYGEAADIETGSGCIGQEAPAMDPLALQGKIDVHVDL